LSRSPDIRRIHCRQAARRAGDGQPGKGLPRRCGRVEYRSLSSFENRPGVAAGPPGNPRMTACAMVCSGSPMNTSPAVLGDGPGPAGENERDA